MSCTSRIYAPIGLPDPHFNPPLPHHLPLPLPRLPSRLVSPSFCLFSVLLYFFSSGWPFLLSSLRVFHGIRLRLPRLVLFCFRMLVSFLYFRVDLPFAFLLLSPFPPPHSPFSFVYLPLFPSCYSLRHDLFLLARFLLSPLPRTLLCLLPSSAFTLAYPFSLLMGFTVCFHCSSSLARVAVRLSRLFRAWHSRPVVFRRFFVVPCAFALEITF